MTVFQCTLTSGYWQKNFLKDKDATDLYTNFWLEVQMKRDATNKFYLAADGLKVDTVTIRSSLGDIPISWILDLVGQDYGAVTASAITAYGDELTTAIWKWHDSYIEIALGAGSYAVLPDMQEYEIRIEHNMRPNFVYNDTGSFTVGSIDDMEHRPRARITHITNDESYIAALIAETAVKLKLNLPDSKYIELTGGKLTQAEPTIKVEDYIISRLEYLGKDYTHNFD